MLPFLSLLWFLLLRTCYAAPIEPPLGLKFDRRGGLPTVTFPDATYQATNYDSFSDVYTFSNIRFASPPIGDLRWAKPAPPPKNASLQDGSYGNSCPQAAPKGLNFLGNGSDTPAGTVIDELLSKFYSPLLDTGAEDCLFLDIYVPGSAVRSPSTSKLPVIHWIYGGGFILGSKNQLQPALPFYDGSGLVSQSGNNVIFVGSNYRLGALGWLAGSSMEEAGLPNAGFYDQQAALQWTHDNIGLLGGDPNSITAMGESAGASSLMHHLVFNGGTGAAPIFNKLILQSPAFLPQFDRKGILEEVFQNFTSLAGCPSSSSSPNTTSNSSSATSQLSCLRSLPSSTIIKANTVLNALAEPGTFIVGPAPDGNLIRQLPALEFASGNYHKNSLSALLITHTSDESTIFVDGHISTDSQFSDFLTHLFPPYAASSGLDAHIEAQYPPIEAGGGGGGGGKYTDESQRVRDMVRDSSFVCNVRYLAQAFSSSSTSSNTGTKVFVGQYALPPSWHATDLLPTFWPHGLVASNPLETVLEAALPLFTGFANAYKSYLTSFVRAGDPNTYRERIGLPFTIEWGEVSGLGGGDGSVGKRNKGGSGSSSGEEVGNVLNMGDWGFSVLDIDEQLGFGACDFWVRWEAAVTAEGGYTPPGGEVETPFWSGNGGNGTASVGAGARASVNYSPGIGRGRGR